VILSSLYLPNFRSKIPERQMLSVYKKTEHFFIAMGGLEMGKSVHSWHPFCVKYIYSFLSLLSLPPYHSWTQRRKTKLKGKGIKPFYFELLLSYLA
jgi:hypothetical protein